MSDDKPVFVQLVELLGVAEAVANDQPAVVITIRPDPPTYFPHNIALSEAQAWRLADRSREPPAPVRPPGLRSPGDDDRLRCKSRIRVGQLGFVIGRDSESGG